MIQAVATIDAKALSHSGCFFFGPAGMQGEACYALDCFLAVGWRRVLGEDRARRSFWVAAAVFLSGGGIGASVDGAAGGMSGPGAAGSAGAGVGAGGGGTAGGGAGIMIG